MKNNYIYYKDKVKSLGYTQADIARELQTMGFFTYKTTERYFEGKAIRKSNEQTIKAYIDNLEPKKVNQ